MINKKNVHYIGKLLLSVMFSLSVFKNLTGGFSGSVEYVKKLKFPFPVLSTLLATLIKAFGVYSLLTGRKVNNIYAITGEIDLNGNVLAIGGLNLKLEGAKKAGVEYVLCPKENEDALTKIRQGKNPPETDNFKIIMVHNIKEVLELMLI